MRASFGSQLDVIDASDSLPAIRHGVDILKTRLEPFGLSAAVALVAPDGTSVPGSCDTGCLGAGEATAADLLFDLRYDLPACLVKRFRRTAFLDIDPGILRPRDESGTYESSAARRLFHDRRVGRSSREHACSSPETSSGCMFRRV